MDSLASAASLAVPVPCAGKSLSPPPLGTSPSSTSSAPLTRPRSGTTGSTSSTGSAPGASKRTKVSRACDECRRKKIRCDIDQTLSSCSSCQRAGCACTFSRIQLKRGPSKRARSQSDVSHGHKPFSKEQLPSINMLLAWHHQQSSPQMIPGGASGMHRPVTGSPQHAHMHIPSPRLGSGPSMHQQLSPVPGMMPGQASQLMHSPPLSSDANWPSIPKAGESPRSGNLFLHTNQVGAPSPLSLNGSGPSPRRGSLPLTSHSLQFGSPGGHNPSGHTANGHSPNQMGLLNSQQNNGAGFQSKSHQGMAMSMPSGFALEVDAQALNRYYQFWHSIFPILPDSPAQLQPILAASPAAPWLVAAINGQVSAVPVDSGIRGPARVAQLMALMFIYLRTLDFTWLGALVGNALALQSEGGAAFEQRLYHLAVVFDRLHAVSHNSRQLMALPVDGSPIDEPLRSTLKALNPSAAATPPPELPNEPAASALKWLGNLDDSQARPELARLLPVLTETPLAGFIRHVIQ